MACDGRSELYLLPCFIPITDGLYHSLTSAIYLATPALSLVLTSPSCICCLRASSARSQPRALPRVPPLSRPLSPIHLHQLTLIHVLGTRDYARDIFGQRGHLLSTRSLTRKAHDGQASYHTSIVQSWHNYHLLSLSTQHSLPTRSRAAHPHRQIPKLRSSPARSSLRIAESSLRLLFLPSLAPVSSGCTASLRLPSRLCIASLIRRAYFLASASMHRSTSSSLLSTASHGADQRV